MSKWINIGVVLWLVLFVWFLHSITVVQPESKSSNPTTLSTRDITTQFFIPKDITPTTTQNDDDDDITTIAVNITPQLTTTTTTTTTPSVPKFTTNFCDPLGPAELEGTAVQSSNIGTVVWKQINDLDKNPHLWIALNNPRTDRYISGTIFSGKWWEPDIVGQIRYYIKGQENVFVDVGANIGYFSLLASSRLAKVYSFEPVFKNFARLKMTRARKGSPVKWHIHNNAVDMESGRIVHLAVASRSSNSGNYKIGKRGKDTALTVKIDDIVKEPVDLMKIDVEGYEARVISGAVQLICQYGVKAIILEYTNDLKEFSTCRYSEMFQWLKTIGYGMYEVNGQRVPDWRVRFWRPRGNNVLFRINGKAAC